MSFATLETRKNLDRVNFRKDFWAHGSVTWVTCKGNGERHFQVENFLK